MNKAKSIKNTSILSNKKLMTFKRLIIWIKCSKETRFYLKKTCLLLLFNNFTYFNYNYQFYNVFYMVVYLRKFI